MSYSRWGSPGRWYCFWSARSKSEKREDQLFEICEIGRGHLFSYAEIKKDINNILDQVEKSYKEPTIASLLKEVPGGATLANAVYEETVIEPDPVSEKELSELKRYLLQFVEDVDEDEDLND